MALSHMPTDSQIVPTAERFRKCNNFAAQFVLDRPIVEIVNYTVLGSVTAQEATTGFTLFGAGNAVFTELATSDITAPLMDADNEAFNVIWMLPADLDPDQQIDFRLLWSQASAAATGSCTWTLKYTVVNADTSAISAPAATALGTAWTGQADLAANIPQWTPWGSIAASTTAVQALTPGDDGLNIKVYPNITTIASCSPLVLQARYYRRLLG